MRCGCAFSLSRFAVRVFSLSLSLSSSAPIAHRSRAIPGRRRLPPPPESPDMMVFQAPAAVQEEEALSRPILERRVEAAAGAISEDEVLVPPCNFGVVEHGIYRSGFPTPANVRFLKTLSLKSIVCLCSEQYSEVVTEFARSDRIRLFQFGLGGTRETLSTVTDDIITGALAVILDIRNHPILIHCKRGKHRTGCLVGCFRKLQNWRISSVHEEYLKFSNPKARESDMRFIETFNVSCLMECVVGIIYRYHGFGNQSRRLAYHETQ